MKNINRLLKYSFTLLKRTIFNFIDSYRYRGSIGYNAEKFWRDRFLKHGLNLKAVGDSGLLEEENKKMYSEAKKVFLEICRQEKINFRNTRILDIGCGNGFYAKIFYENGATDYLGIDITDILFYRLHSEFPNFQFIKQDISTQELKGVFDLIIMIDVTQHITKKENFSFAMQNIKSHLNKDGVFIVTSWLNEKARQSFYEVSRSFNIYQREFPGYTFSKSFSFRDKFIFSIKSKN